jgi:hypothetical protein
MLYASVPKSSVLWSCYQWVASWVLFPLSYLTIYMQWIKCEKYFLQNRELYSITNFNLINLWLSVLTVSVYLDACWYIWMHAGIHLPSYFPASEPLGYNNILIFLIEFNNSFFFCQPHKRHSSLYDSTRSVHAVFYPAKPFT